MSALEKMINGHPFYVAYGLGVDSTAMLIKLRDLGLRPVEILFADTGSEKPETYNYLPIMQAWLKKNNFPAIKIIKRHEQVKMRVPDRSLEDELIRLRRMPSLAFGLHSCSAKWKVDPQLKYLKRQLWTNHMWIRGDRVIRCIGLDNSKSDCVRTPRTLKHDSDEYLSCFPLQELEITRSECVEIIEAEGLPVPAKSACYFCPAMKAHEIVDLDTDQLTKSLDIEKNAMERIKEEEPQRIALGKNPTTTKGLGRSRSWADIIEKSTNQQEK